MLQSYVFKDSCHQFFTLIYENSVYKCIMDYFAYRYVKLWLNCMLYVCSLADKDVIDLFFCQNIVYVFVSCKENT